MTLKKHNFFDFWLLLVVPLLLLTLFSCRDDREKLTTLGGVIEDSNLEEDSKVYLGNRERWLYWENGDQIFVWSSSTETGTYDLDEDSHKQLMGNFKSESSTVTANSKIYAFYPPSLATAAGAGGGTVTNDGTTIFWPRSHVYRENNTATEPDSSFGKAAMPMVAYREAHDSRPLFFHSLAGIMRFQLFAGAGLTDEANDEFTIQTITFEANPASTDKRLSGLFTISKNSLENNQPYITSVADPTPSDEDRTVSITGINKKIGGTGGNKNNLFTFYLPLPAVANPYGDGQHYTRYQLKMHVIGTQNNGTEDVAKYFVRTLTVDIRRLSITMMPAMEINSVVDASAGTGSTGTPTIVGCGTEDRPFQIYTADQLVYLRERFNAGERVNGQAFGSSTYVKICRSDITLLPPSSKALAAKDDPTGTSAVWTEGFNNFSGVMYFSSSAGENGGIANLSNAPLFEEIAASGNVTGVYVKGDKTFSSGSGTFSPLCNVNNGTMTDCHNLCNVTSTSGHNLAGLCVTNNGTITGGANVGLLHTTGGNVAGICYTNNGVLQGDFSLSTAIPHGDNIAGICFTNSSTGRVEDCQVSANVNPYNASGNWGVIVFSNSGSVTNCRSVGSAVFSTSGSVGGVVNTNYSGGVIDGCSRSVMLRGGGGSVGGIVAVMEGGTVRNCAVDREKGIYGTPSGSSNQADYAGGIVGWLKAGEVYNSYSLSSVTGAVNGGSVIGRIDKGATIENCWSDITTPHFVGDVSTTRPDQGEIGPFCFSGSASDTTRDCSLILPKWYRIMVPWNLKHKVDVAEAALGTDETLSGVMARFKSLRDGFYVPAYYGTSGTPPDPNASTRPTGDKYLYEALNLWVTNYGGGVSWSWTSTENANYDIYPIYTNSKNAAKRYPPVTARHSYKRR